MGQTARCKHCDQPPVPNRTLCQAHAERQKMYSQRYLGKRSAENPAADSESCAPLCTTVVKATKPRKAAPVVESIVVTPTSLDEAIERMRGDLEAMERTKAILERQQA